MAGVCRKKVWGAHGRPPARPKPNPQQTLLAAAASHRPRRDAGLLRKRAQQPGYSWLVEARPETSNGMGNYYSSTERAIERLEEALRASQEQARLDRELLLSTMQRNQDRLELVLASSYEIVLRDFNAYEQMSETEASDAKNAKTEYMSHFDMRADNVKCALTGLRGKVKLAHILPRKATKHVCRSLGMSNNALNNHRNLIFLCFNIEAAFDKLRISFVPQDALHDALVMKIWDESVRYEPIFSGSPSTIGEFEHRALNFLVEGSDGVTREHRPFRRCFAYQALMCYCRHATDLDAEPPSDPRGSEVLLEYKTMRKRLLEMHQNFRRGLTREISEEAQPQEEQEQEQEQ